VDTLETARLKLERWNVRRDAADLFAYAKNPNVGPNAGWAPHKTIRESRKRIRSIFIPNDTWKIVDKQTGRAIGSIGFSPDARRPRVRAAELGYSMSEEYWGLGLMTEAAQEVLRYAFQTLRYELVTITTNPANKRSQRVIEKLGFTYEGTLRYSYMIYDGSVRDTMCFSMFRSEWELMHHGDPQITRS
jgi:Acetyltransferases, including N-acetylases of ribosomal proteins